MKHGSQTRAPDYIAAAAALDGRRLVTSVRPNGPEAFEVHVRAMRGRARARWFDPADGSWRAIAAALPNGGPQAFRVPGRNAAKDQEWVLLPDAAPPMSWPRR